MKRTWLTGLLTGLAVGLGGLAVAQKLHAQPAAPKAAALTGRIACVDVVQVFNEYQKQKDLSEEMSAAQTRAGEEDKQRRNKIDAAQAALDALDTEDPTYIARTREMLALQVDYKNWVELKKADMTREIAVWSVRIYKDITRGIEELARAQGYDMVLYKGQFDTVSLDPDVIKEQIRRIQLLYANPEVDITQALIDKLNTDYRAQPRVKMMLEP